MIRDPSDGGVREPKKSAPEFSAPHNSGERLPSSDAAATGADTTPVIETTTAGLPAASAKDADRHARSREWLEKYHAKKGQS